jgi:hypothetical protein
MAFQALECPIFKAFIGGRHAHQFHLRRAFWTSWHQVNVRNVWDSTFQFRQRPLPWLQKGRLPAANGALSNSVTGKIAVRRSKRLNRRNGESQVERPVTRTIKTICPFGGRVGDLRRVRRSAGQPRADLPRSVFCHQGRGVSSNSRRLRHDRWRQDRSRGYGDGFVQQSEYEPGRVCSELLRHSTKDEPAGRRRAAATMERPQELVRFGLPDLRASLGVPIAIPRRTSSR